MIAIRPISSPALVEFQPLIDASIAEGYDFVQKLREELELPDVFSGAGAGVLGAYAGDILVAVGGVHRDPYLNLPTVGRIRHVYVLPAYRRGGVGKQLVRALVEQGSAQFTTFTLRTPTAHGDAFYQAIGFSTVPRFANATHWLERQPDSSNATE